MNEAMASAAKEDEVASRVITGSTAVADVVCIALTERLSRATPSATVSVAGDNLRSQCCVKTFIARHGSRQRFIQLVHENEQLVQERNSRRDQADTDDHRALHASEPIKETANRAAAPIAHSA